ncbi:Secretion-associated RAS super family 2 isoform 1 [Hibiscus syriacus]|uniref:Secretion-associated RAS super family 2 isoform 1 n=1 Tax=Hibiscus syriacus TaxID=106335 RepID=A0A6A3C7U8_HIBSY|nr:Secretion-associated RAS super family 2 isoform 1 [Hibiscus syriacus]
MGNIASGCFIPDSIRKNIAEVIDARGNIWRVKLPVKAAEIMLEEPGHVISSVKDLKRTRSVVAVRADDELLAGEVYVLVPIGRVRNKVTDTDMAIIEAVCRGKKTRKSGAKVSPEVEESGVRVAPVAAPRGYRSGSCRPWTPVLESITEVL